MSRGIQLKHIDAPFSWVSPATRRRETLWAKSPVTEEEAARKNNAREAAIASLRARAKPEETQALVMLEHQEPVKATEGEPWTLRYAIMQVLFSDKWPNREIDPKTNKPKKEEPGNLAKLQNIGLAFERAPVNGTVNLGPEHALLLRTKVYEATGLDAGGSIPMVVKALVDEALDEAEGVRDQHRVTFSAPETEAAAV